MSEKLIKVVKEGQIAILTIQRPSALNALNREVLTQIGQEVDVLEKDKNIRVLIVTGEGKAFVAGADIAEMKTLNVSEGEEFSKLGNEVFQKLHQSRIVSIAAINGFSLGGGMELALACDIRVGSEKAKLGLPEVSLGLIPGFGGTQRLARLIGYARAIELVVTGDMITAEEGYRIGILNKLVKEGENILDFSKTIADSILKKGPHAIERVKRTIQQGLDVTLKDGISIEEKEFGACFDGGQSKEGMTAFLEKRPPRF
ncbi:MULTISPECIES: enoyl-CoA hydratase-related protein [Leptospira]|uniref:3-hydroxybutyryl-CoA dehydratase n=4 Tax=Leptospira borgpetersenii TaxID=174 RepID=M3H3E9_LEPBO|nr:MULTISPECIES: enoyl-CoA hydratase-related protein [Leptospira]EMG01609.1 3-hydroxybutyryl-CoA dehydratase [Leptospira borgpetersenii str. 200701203]EMO09761.1 3-hydroxybutyryl-CoA dehydratase [Leptospira borgpetersenii str. Noumea 25]ALO24839.1 3-hydroxybutyryl-CoA dehydratase [Leptospira borgpetersenii serovar Ballum]ANG99903.1 3-hydroxybutyryl-CoA dehydratase [Leptospira borgpetersenii str. 4E]AXX15345.1 crotonase [Leptospira borgpetersenii serovar Ceylonica]